MTSGVKVDELVITNIEKEKPGFVFYISYYIRNAENNFDEINMDNQLKLDIEKQIYLFIYIVKLDHISVI